MKLSLRVKAAGVFVLLATLPALVTGALLVGINSDAVRSSELQLQAAVVGELSAWLSAHLSAVQDDLSAVGQALLLQAQQPEGPSLIPLRSVVASSRHVGSVRFLVPDAQVNTAIVLDERPVPEVPSTLLDAARVQGVALGRGEADVLMVARVPRSRPGAPLGFVAARVSLEPLRRRLRETAENRFGAVGVTLLIADEVGRSVVGYSADAEHDPPAASPFQGWLPSEGAQAGFSRVQSIELGGGRVLGGLEVLSKFGWSVAMWRSEKVAYAALTLMRRRTIQASLIATLLALGLGLVGARRLTQPILQMATSAELIGQRRWEGLPRLRTTNDELGQLAQSLQVMATDLQANEAKILSETRLRANLSRFMSQQLVDRIVTGQHDVELGGVRATVTVLFVDVVGFTPIAEAKEPERVVTFLNELFSLITEVVFRHGGIVDKFIGDSVMAVFGAPEPDPQQVTHALRSAEDILRFTRLANQYWTRELGRSVDIAMGVNTGECIVGNIGSQKRMEYTVIGDAVNVAARLEKRAAPNQVLVGENTQERASQEFRFAFVGEHAETGRERAIRVFELGVSA